MKNNKKWIEWIDDQIDDMYNEDYLNEDNNRVFKTEEDDRNIAVHILKKLKSLLEDER